MFGSHCYNFVHLIVLSSSGERPLTYDMTIPKGHSVDSMSDLSSEGITYRKEWWMGEVSESFI